MAKNLLIIFAEIVQCQWFLSLIHKSNHLVQLLESQYREDRTEDLLLHHRCVRTDICENGRGEIALLAVIVTAVVEVAIGDGRWAIGNGRWAIGDNGEIEVPTVAKKDLAKLFQALRIEVNDEMGALREMLLAAKDLLRPGGRIAILTYHSLEDRMVKNFLRSGNLEGKIEKDFYGNILSPFKVIEKGLTASAEEVERNPRARSAKLRVAEKI